MTERVRNTFVVKQYADGTPFIVLEPTSHSLSVIKRGFLGFNLRKDITAIEAQRFADELNNQITDTTYTNLIGED